MLRRLATVLGVFLALIWAAPAAEAAPREIIELYQRFAAAQNQRDLDSVRGLFDDSGPFLWVSDGMSVWGADAAIARMKSFQLATTWRVEPDLAQARVVEIDAAAAYLHLPLDLVIGEGATPDRLHFLVTMLCAKSPRGWRIAALLTTTAKR